MNRAIETRELITLDGLGVLVQGTYHRYSEERLQLRFAGE